LSSFEIEHEHPSNQRQARFIDLLKRARSIPEINKKNLLELQNMIVDARFIDFDYRHTQNYVGEQINQYLQKIHYISPKPEDVPDIMEGLLSALDRMLSSEVHPVLIAASISFGFVFIHPFEDGNGRIHRFLIHYVLSKKEFTPKGMIFPISSVMLKNMVDYDDILESFSTPLLDIITDYQLSEIGELSVKGETKPFYQYVDYTHIAEYLFQCVEKTIEEDLKEELLYLSCYDVCKQSIQNFVDMPDKYIDLIIKFL